MSIYYNIISRLLVLRLIQTNYLILYKVTKDYKASQDIRMNASYFNNFSNDVEDSIAYILEAKDNSIDYGVFLT